MRARSVRSGLRAASFLLATLVGIALTVVALSADLGARRVTCADEPTLISASDGSGDGVYLLLRNTDDTDSVFLGGSDVDTDEGFELPAERDVPVHLKATESLYCIVASGTVRVDVLEGSVE